MSSKPIPIAVIGGSGFIGKRHCQHVASNPDTSVVAIVDPSPAAEAVAASFSVPLYPSIQQLISSTSSPQAAIVCTPNATHVPLSIALLREGIHVLCEKPISTDLGSARQLVDEAGKANGAKLLVGHHRRFNPYVVAMKKVLDSGRLGEITAVMGCWTTYKPDPYFASGGSWRLDRQQGGGVTLLNFVHEIDLLQYFFGPVVRVQTERTASRRSKGPDSVEEGAAMTLRFESGVVGTFIVSDAVASSHNFEAATGENPIIPKARPLRDVYHVFGTRGTLGFPSMQVDAFGGMGASWENELKVEEFPVDDAEVAPLAAQLAHFVRICRREEEPKCSGEDGFRALEVCETVRRQLFTQE